MRRYEKYKPSNVDWIGEIPASWNVSRLKFLGDSIIGITYSPDDVVTDESQGILVLRSSNVQNGKIELADNVFVNKKISDKHTTRFGDILICARNGSAHLVGKSAFIGNEHAGLSFGAFMSIVRSTHGKFLYYFFNSEIFKSQTGLFSTSTINQLTSETLDNMVVAVPSSSEEQTAIANYLDEKTAQIDTLIEKKQKLIELLKEERKGIINNALSGQGKNWGRKKLKYLTTKIGSGVTPTGGASVYLQEGIPLLRSQNIYSDGLVLDDVAFISKEIYEQMSNSKVQEGDVFLNITGASIGRCFYLPKDFGPANVNQHVCIIRPIKELLRAEYLHLFLISDNGQRQIDLCQNGANREGLNYQQISAFEILLPKISEQDELLRTIFLEMNKRKRTIEKIESEVEFMSEYKTALISEVVTGKVKVA